MNEIHVLMKSNHFYSTKSWGIRTMLLLEGRKIPLNKRKSEVKVGFISIPISRL
jgi:hypothetical protein